MANLVDSRLEKVREALHEAGKYLSPRDWLDLLEELSADIDGHIDAARKRTKIYGEGLTLQWPTRGPVTNLLADIDKLGLSRGYER